MPALAGDAVTLRDHRSGLGSEGKPWRIGPGVYGGRDILPGDLLPRDVTSRKLSVRDAGPFFFIRHAGFSIHLPCGTC